MSSVHTFIQRLTADLRYGARQLRRSPTFTIIAVLTLACLGIYGTLAYAVNRRSSEIGLRMALGARRGHIFGIVLRETLAPVLIGIALGVCGSMALTRMAQGLYFGISPNDPLSIVCAAALFLVVATIAAMLPARRASGIDPMQALRYE